jgi:hypothetical protein
VALLLGSSAVDPTVLSSAASLGLVGAMLGYEAANLDVVSRSLRSRRSMAEDGKQGSSTLRKPWGAVGIVALLLGLGLLPGSMVDNVSHAGGLAAGVALGFTMGPRFSLIQEVEIPAGSMTVPEDAPEVNVVLDRRTPVERVLVGAGAAGALAAALAVGGAALHH